MYCRPVLWHSPLTNRDGAVKKKKKPVMLESNFSRSIFTTKGFFMPKNMPLEYVFERIITRSKTQLTFEASVDNEIVHITLEHAQCLEIVELVLVSGLRKEAKALIESTRKIGA